MERTSRKLGVPFEGTVRPKETPAAPEGLMSLEQVERRHILQVLQHTRGRVSGAGGAAEILGLKPSTLQFWIDKLELRNELRKARVR